MVNKLFRIFKILSLFFKVNFLVALEYRINFFTLLIPTVLYSAGYIFFLQTIVSQFPSVAGWDRNMLILLFAIEQITYYSSWLLFRDSLRYFSEAVKKGDFDSILKLPFNTRLLASFRFPQPHNLLAYLIPMIMIFYVYSSLQIQIVPFLFFTISLVFGFGVLYNLFFVTSCISFWITDSEDVEDLVDVFVGFARYPAGVFPDWLSAVFMFVFPILIVAYIPTSILIEKLTVWSIFLSIGMFLFTYIVSRKIWQAGLRQYSSASS